MGWEVGKEGEGQNNIFFFFFFQNMVIYHIKLNDEQNKYSQKNLSLCGSAGPGVGGVCVCVGGGGEGDVYVYGTYLALCSTVDSTSDCRFRVSCLNPSLAT